MSDTDYGIWGWHADFDTLHDELRLVTAPFVVEGVGVFMFAANLPNNDEAGIMTVTRKACYGR